MDEHADKLHRYQKEHQLAKISFEHANTHLVNAKAVLNRENVAFEHAKMHLTNAKAVLNWERVRSHQEKKSEEECTAQKRKDCTRMEKRRQQSEVVEMVAAEELEATAMAECLWL